MCVEVCVMNAAICDDEPALREQVRKYIERFAVNYPIKISEFESGEELVEQYGQGKRFDIIFLDIVMGGMNGIEAARKIRETDQRVVIIFLTNLIDYALEGYMVKAFRYILKPIHQEDFNKIFKRALEEIEASERQYILLYTTGKSIIRQNISEIMYIESFGRKLIIHLPGNNLAVKSSLSSEEDKILQSGFVKIHKSYLVNLAFVAKVSRNAVVLTNNEMLPLSRHRQKPVYDAFTRYLVNSTMI